MSPPQGTVTFLFTDIEGSTRLLQQVGGQHATDVLATHRRLLRNAIDAHSGHKDLARSQRIYQVMAQDLAAEFPPIRSLDTLPNNLPVPLTRFIGRD